MNQKQAVLLVNLGTPKTYNPQDVGQYLKEFLSDKNVLSIPQPLRWFLVNVLIVPKRKYRSSKLYQKIWTQEGSPLLVHSKQLQEQLQKMYSKEEVQVCLAMRYQDPSLQTELEKLYREKFSKIIVVPLFPQYAQATTGSVIESVCKIAKRIGFDLKQIRFIKSFYNEVGFIESFAAKTQQFLLEQKVNVNEVHFVMSFHGLPQSQVRQADKENHGCLQFENCCEKIIAKNEYCYRAQCYESARLLAKKLGLNTTQYTVAFQSRFGSAKWIEPYLDEVIQKIAKNSPQKIVVVCALSFVTDCLETLEEIAIQTRDSYMRQGVRNLILVPSMNADEIWTKSLKKLIDLYRFS